MNVLFVTWDGPQTNYLESLFLPIFQGLLGRGVHVHVLQFTWGDAQRVERTRQACTSGGVPYAAVRIRRRPKTLGAAVTLLLGFAAYQRCLRQWRIDVTMPRSTLPGLLALAGARFNRCPIAFDADGLALDERVEFAGQRPSSWLHRWQRDGEAELVRISEVVLTRTARASQILLARGGAGTDREKFHVVSNGREAALFTPGTRASRDAIRQGLGIGQDVPVLVYAGSIGPQYCLAEMADLFARILARRADAVWLILARETPRLRDALNACGVPDGSVRIGRVEAAEVPAHMACGDAGVSLRRTGFAMQGVAPIKLGEYLLCGLPVIATSGVGDTQCIHQQAGRLLHAMDDAELSATANWFVDEVLPARDAFRAASRDLGQAHFSLQASVEDYARALAGVAGAG